MGRLFSDLHENGLTAGHSPRFLSHDRFVNVTSSLRQPIEPSKHETESTSQSEKRRTTRVRSNRKLGSPKKRIVKGTSKS